VRWKTVRTYGKILATPLAEFQAKNASQPMQSHQIPDRPGSKVATDLFTVSGKNYITIVD